MHIDREPQTIHIETIAQVGEHIIAPAARQVGKLDWEHFGWSREQVMSYYTEVFPDLIIEENSYPHFRVADTVGFPLLTINLYEERDWRYFNNTPPHRRAKIHKDRWLIQVRHVIEEQTAELLKRYFFVEAIEEICIRQGLDFKDVNRYFWANDGGTNWGKNVTERTNVY